MIIRQEVAEDYAEVYNIVKIAFSFAEHCDGNEQDLVCKLRKSESFVPELSLVAVDGDNIIGHIMFTTAKICETTVLALAPLSVLPEYQKQGVGSKLVLEGHKVAKSLGYQLCVVLGSEIYYPKFGYTQALKFGITAPFDVPSENFMAIALDENFQKISGVLQYAKEFFEM
ncbi:MAG: N-acetyltransferase [Clostridia bacterium]